MVSLQRLDRQLTYVVGDGGAGLSDARRARQTDPNKAIPLVHVEAGIRIATLSELLDAQGLALPTLGGSNGQALAGVVSTSTHGGDWQQQPFPDLVRALHLVTDGGRELWIEPESAPITTDGRLQPVLPCAETTIIRDNNVFNAAIVACGRFGVLYSLVLQVTRSFRVVEAVTTPARTAVLKALRDGVSDGTLFAPVFAMPASPPIPAVLDDATGTPYFLQVLFNSQNPEDVWVHQRWVTTNSSDLPPPPQPAPGTVTATDSDAQLAQDVFEWANLAFPAVIAQAYAMGGLVLGLYVTGVVASFDVVVASRPFTLGSVVSAALEAMWKIPLAGYLIPTLNDKVLDGRFRPAITGGRRGPHYLMTSGERAGSDSTSYRAASIEVVFDATTTNYLDFLDEILALAPSFQQAGYISLRPSLASNALLSMHHVAGSHAISIEISSLQYLPGNSDWMAFVHGRAVARNGRPHWGQYNKLDESAVSMLYGADLNRWREALLLVSGTSTQFSNAFTQRRGLEPMGIARQIVAVRKDGNGAITHLCNRNFAWSPVTVQDAITQIQAGTVQYVVGTANHVVPLKVVAGRYLRSTADDTAANNLDSLPPC